MGFRSQTHPHKNNMNWFDAFPTIDYSNIEFFFNILFCVLIMFKLQFLSYYQSLIIHDDEESVRCSIDNCNKYLTT